jgi:DNA polymerase-3 subunit alpha
LGQGSDPFVHLHLHTEYSMLDGAARVGEVVAAVKADGAPAVGITDHGNMYGVLDFWKACRQAEITPVIGMEGYFVTTDRFDRPKRDDHEIRHLTLLAESTVGYHNLIKISSRAYLDGFFYKPRLDFELLEQHHEGLIATTGCLGSEICQRLLKGDEEGALEMAGRFQDILGRDSFFVELQDHGLPEQEQVFKQLLRIAEQIQAPLLATNDSHYVNREHAEAHAALLCVQTGATLDDPKRFKFDADEFYVKPAVEMRHLFREVPEACDNTLWIAERADVDIEFGTAVLPAFPVPEGHTEESYLRELVETGVRQRYGDPIPDHVRDRLEYELGVITDMGFPGYFLVVWDLIDYAKRTGIRVGPGRGSAAGSLVAFCLRITELDPIKYDLLFERFLNPGRKQMPDIDMDFDERYRGDMIKYAAERYGDDHVAQIITFSTIKARAAVRDAARVLGYPYAVGDKIAKLMPPLIMGRDTPLYACLDPHPKYEDGYKMAGELRGLYGDDPDARRVIDVARGLEGLRRQDGIHAAAVVITREPLTEYLPIQRKPEAAAGKDGGASRAEREANAPIVTQYEMHGVEELGLLKMDFLGLRNLSVIERALELIERSTGTRPDIDAVALDDEPTFEMLRRADTIGVFQLEGGPMRALVRSLAPTTFEDVCALIALYRPGPMAANMHTDYADRKNGRQAVTYYHDDLDEILGETYGLMIYQEQLMRVAQKLAGYSLAEADNLRKATGKKIREVIAKERVRFVEGCANQGYGADFGEKMFDIIEPFADYSFNKSHSFAYGLVSYQTAWLKANHPVEYLAALLTSVKTNQDKAAVYLNECRQQGIEVLVPDVNVSEADFAVADGKITFGLSGIRNVGEGVVEHIVAARDADGPFADFFDFCDRVDPVALNKRTVESLVKAGAFDALGHPRQGLLFVFETAIDRALERRRERDAGIMSLFGDLGGGTDDPVAPAFDRITIPNDEFDKSQRLAFEKEMLGLYVSDHPLMGAQKALARHCDASINDLRDLRDGELRIIGGVVTNLARKYTKRGDLMATFVLEDLEAAVEVMVFPKTMVEHGHQLVDDAIVCVKGRLDTRDETPKLICMEVKRPELVLDGGPPVRLKLSAGALSETRIGSLRDLLAAHPGDSPVFVHLDSGPRTTVLRLGDDFLVDARNGLFGELRVLFGSAAVL